MADIELSVAHGTDQATAKSKTDQVLQKMAEKMGLEVAWDGDEATLAGTGLKEGTVSVDSENVRIRIRLALMAKPMKGMIEEKIRARIDKALRA